MANTFIRIATVTVGSTPQSSIVFSNIPQTYTDLKLVLSTRSSASANAWSDYYISLNGTSTITNWTSRVLYGTGSSSASSTYSSSLFTIGEGNAGSSSVFGIADIYIPNYTSTNNQVLSSESGSENNATSSLVQFGAALWSNNNSAITSITLTDYNSGNFVQYSSATLYGIKSS